MIGRIIRSKNDYGAILLIDQRFSREDILDELPQWIKKGLTLPEPYEETFLKFFKEEEWIQASTEI